ncbi:hypothetical protein ACSBR2_029518 [Camellia fascicularis]
MKATDRIKLLPSMLLHCRSTSSPFLSPICPSSLNLPSVDLLHFTILSPNLRENSHLKRKKKGSLSLSPTPNPSPSLSFSLSLSLSLSLSQNLSQINHLHPLYKALRFPSKPLFDPNLQRFGCEVEASEADFARSPSSALLPTSYLRASISTAVVSSSIQELETDIEKHHKIKHKLTWM